MTENKSATWRKLLDGVKSVVELRIVTYVGDVEISGDFCSPDIKFAKDDQQKDKPQKAIVTCVNLAEGDITSCFPDEYLGEDRNWVRKYHSDQVKQGKEIVDHNIRLIGSLGKEVAAAIQALRDVEK